MIVVKDKVSLESSHTRPVDEACSVRVLLMGVPALVSAASTRGLSVDLRAAQLKRKNCGKSFSSSTANSFARGIKGYTGVSPSQHADFR